MVQWIPIAPGVKYHFSAEQDAIFIDQKRLNLVISHGSV